jgi:lipopolysaccharide export LptBFGC system permease protein LptF
LWLYLRATTAVSALGRYGMGAFVAVMLAINYLNLFGPMQGDSKIALSISALASYFLFAAVGFWLDRKRT